MKDYTRTVDFTTGEVEVKWQDVKGTFSRKAFISRPDNVVVMELTSNNNVLSTLHWIWRELHGVTSDD